jgi:hypothetical protein
MLHLHFAQYTINGVFPYYLRRTGIVVLFLQNWAASSSFVEVIDGASSEAHLTRIDGSTRALQ